jgi:hypothetical protein
LPSVVVFPSLVSVASPEASRPLGSPFSSNVVAEVEYESCAEELRLWGGEGRLNNPSDPRAPGPLEIDLLSPLPFSKLGVDAPTYLVCTFGLVDCFDRRNVFLDPPGVTGLVSVDSRLLSEAPPGVKPPDNGLGGKLVVRTPPLGGCGNALMLIVFRIVFPAPFTPGAVRNLGRAVLLPPGVDGRLDVEGARRPLFGNPPACRLAIVGTLPVLFRVFVVGNAGSAVVGGP